MFTDKTDAEKVDLVRDILHEFHMDARKEATSAWESHDKESYDGWTEYAAGVCLALSLLDQAFPPEEAV